MRERAHTPPSPADDRRWTHSAYLIEPNLARPEERRAEETADDEGNDRKKTETKERKRETETQRKWGISDDDDDEDAPRRLPMQMQCPMPSVHPSVCPTRSFCPPNPVLLPSLPLPPVRRRKRNQPNQTRESRVNRPNADDQIRPAESREGQPAACVCERERRY
jgi:hypothetical protein